ncbi:MAG: glycosyltransferase family 4 protein [Thermodesulfobacteriota bacterium]
MNIMSPPPAADLLFTSAYGEMLGGGQHSLLLLLHHLDRNRFRPHLAVPTGGELLNRAGAAGVHPFLFATPPIRRLHLPAVFAIARRLRALRIRLVHADSPRQALYFGLAAKLCRLPLVWHVRVGDPDRCWVDRTLHLLADRIIAVNGDIGERFRRMGRPEKVRVVHNGAEIGHPPAAVERQAARARLAIPATTLVVGTVGRLHPLKGQDRLITACAGLPAAGREDFRLVIVGAGDDGDFERLKLIAGEAGIAERVVFTGRRDDVAALLPAFDIFALPTLFREGFSRVIAEAMAAGLPVVATRLGGNREAVDHGRTGLLLDPDRLDEELGRVLTRLAGDAQLRARLGITARRHAESHFDIGRQVERIQEIYEELL